LITKIGDNEDSGDPFFRSVGGQESDEGPKFLPLNWEGKMKKLGAPRREGPAVLTWQTEAEKEKAQKELGGGFERRWGHHRSSSVPRGEGKMGEARNVAQRGRSSI